MKPVSSIIADVNIPVIKLVGYGRGREVKLNLLANASRGSYSQKLKLLSLITISLVLANTSYGTSIVILRTPTELVLAADSKETPAPIRTVCKIKQVGSVFFATTGSVENRVIGFDASAILTEACQKGQDLTEIASLAIQKVKPFLLRILQAMQERERVKACDETHPYFGFVICGVEGGILKYVTRQLICKVQNDGSLNLVPVVKDCPGTCSTTAVRNGLSFMTLGKTEASTAYYDRLAAEPRLLSVQVRKLPDFARLLVEKDIEASVNRGGTEDNVGGPVDVLRIDTKGIAEWKYRKPECAKITPSAKKPSKRR